MVESDKKLKQRPRLKDLGKHGLWIYGAVVSLAMRESITTMFGHMRDAGAYHELVEALGFLAFLFVIARFYLGAALFFESVHGESAEGSDGLLRVHAEAETCDVCQPPAPPAAPLHAALEAECVLGDQGGAICVTHDRPADWVECTGWYCDVSRKIIKRHETFEEEEARQAAADPKPVAPVVPVAPLHVALRALVEELRTNIGGLGRSARTDIFDSGRLSGISVCVLRIEAILAAHTTSAPKAKP